MVPGLDGQHHVQAMAKLLLVEDLGLAIPAGAQMHTNRFGLVIVLKVHSAGSSRYGTDGDSSRPSIDPGFPAWRAPTSPTIAGTI
jgi:hypothetical protein